jgi:hypothetical protein
MDGIQSIQARPRHARFEKSFSQIEPSNDLLIPRAVFARQVFEQLIATAHQLEQPTSRGMVLLMGIEMLTKRVDSLGDQRDLHFGRTGILLVDLIIFDDFLFLSGGNCHWKNSQTPGKPAKHPTVGRPGKPVIKGSDAKAVAFAAAPAAFSESGGRIEGWDVGVKWSGRQIALLREIHIYFAVLYATR